MDGTREFDYASHGYAPLSGVTCDYPIVVTVLISCKRLDYEFDPKFLKTKKLRYPNFPIRNAKIKCFPLPQPQSEASPVNCEAALIPPPKLVIVCWGDLKNALSCTKEYMQPCF